MANDVFANGLEIACKAGSGKVVAAFPDVCLSPPSPPAGPIPVPYPVTSKASDTTGGSKKVKISNKEVMLKNKSCYKKCMGDEAATKSLGMGVITHCIQGKTYFASWSPDVKFEGYNVDRHTDITNSNGQSTTNQFGMVNFDSSTFDSLGACDGVSEDFRLVPYHTDRSSGEASCPNPETGHHLIPGRLMNPTSGQRYQAGNGKCSHKTAPVMCALGRNQHGNTSHAHGHAEFDFFEHLCATSGQTLPYPEALDNATRSAGVIANGTPLEPGDEAYDCVKQQLDEYYEKCGIAEDHQFSPSTSGSPALNLTRLS